MRLARKTFPRDSCIIYDNRYIDVGTVFIQKVRVALVAEKPTPVYEI